MTPREYKRQREAELRFEMRRRLRTVAATLKLNAAAEKQAAKQAEEAQRILFISKKARDSYLRWKARKKAEKAAQKKH